MFPDPKASLRRQMSGLLREMRDEAPTLSARIVRAIGSSPFWRAGKTVMAYLAMPGEVDLDALWSLEDRPRLCVPVPDWDSRSMTPVVIEDLARDLRRMREGRHPSMPGGLREPAHGLESVVPSELDVILVPALAFDPRGRRLGRSGGFYDRFLGGLGPQTLTVGVCFGGQLVQDVPVEPHDVAVRMLVTEHGVRSI